MTFQPGDLLYHPQDPRLVLLWIGKDGIWLNHDIPSVVGKLHQGCFQLNMEVLEQKYELVLPEEWK